jgi:hypothetical protein
MSDTSKEFCGVTRVSGVEVQLNEGPWAFAKQNTEAIAAFWQKKQKSHPHFFDGKVHVMTSWEIRDFQTSAAVFVGRLQRTNFASFLYWKETDAKMQWGSDFSGGGALFCTDGGLLMAVSGEHAVIPRLLEFPSGFVDVADFDGNKLDFDRHVEREVMEEFAITKAQLGEKHQYLVSAADGIVQVVSAFVVDMNGVDFVQTWRHRTGLMQPEISDIVAIYRPSDLAGFQIQAHVQTAVSYLVTLANCPRVPVCGDQRGRRLCCCAAGAIDAGDKRRSIPASPQSGRTFHTRRNGN